MQSLADFFPHLKACHYLDTATVGLSAPGCGAAAAHFLDDVKSQGISGMVQWQAVAQRLRDQVTQMFDAPDHACEFLGSTSEGTHLFSRALRWSQGDAVVVAQDEFPSVRHAWDHCTALGVDVRAVPIAAEGRREDILLAALAPGVKVLAVSQVHWVTGTALNLQRLGDACRRNGILFFVDGTQAAGAVRTQLAGIDAYCAAGFKWLAGPFGIAFLLVDRALRSQLQPTVLGAWNIQQADGDRDLRYGHMNYPGIYALHAALDFAQSQGWDEIFARTAHLTDRLHAGLVQRGIHPLCKRERSAGITSFVLQDALGLQQFAAKAGVQVGVKWGVKVGAEDGDVLRVSPHFYNGDADVDALLHALDRWRRP